jgi:hypothetical protein
LAKNGGNFLQQIKTFPMSDSLATVLHKMSNLGIITREAAQRLKRPCGRFEVAWGEGRVNRTKKFTGLPQHK